MKPPHFLGPVPQGKPFLLLSAFLVMTFSVTTFCSSLEAQTLALPDVPKLLPKILTTTEGGEVKTSAQWAARREQLRELLLANEYGFLPPSPGNVTIKATTSFTNNWGARQEHLIVSCGPRGGMSFEIDLLLPADKSKVYPVIVTGDSGQNPIPSEVVERGYILAQFDRNQFAPDQSQRSSGIYPLYPEFEGGTLAAWAWGYARVVDALLMRADVDAGRIAVTGHSRGGKAALLAGALDERVALTIANQSGSGGASPFRVGGKGSESLGKITGRFGYWFHPRLKEFVGREAEMPFDQHFLLALVAPRALLLNSALQDPYSNPLAVQSSFEAAREVFALLGVSGKIGSHYRAGGHSFSAQDWRVLLDFADAQFFGRATATALK